MQFLHVFWLHVFAECSLHSAKYQQTPNKTLQNNPTMYEYRWCQITWSNYSRLLPECGWQTTPAPSLGTQLLGYIYWHLCIANSFPAQFTSSIRILVLFQKFSPKNDSPVSTTAPLRIEMFKFAAYFLLENHILTIFVTVLNNCQALLTKQAVRELSNSEKTVVW